MTNPVTPNIGLNKIDRTSPATTYFDLEKYIDQNADTVDRFAGEASQAIEALQERLDTEARREVVLQPGLQIVNAERSAPFSLSGIKGRTLVNLLGRIGRFSSLDHIAGSGNHSVSLDSTNKTVGDNGLKVVSLGKGNAGDASNLIRIGSHTYKDNARYIIIADIKANTTFTLHCELWGGLGSVKEAEISTSWSSLVFRGIGDSRGLGLHFWNLSDKGVTFYLSGLRIYEVTDADYNESDEKLIQKYPYVDSIQPVRNPYAIRHGENLLPPFYEWDIINTKGRVVAPYEYQQLGADDGHWTQVVIKVLKNTDYYISSGDSGLLAVSSADNTSILFPYATAGSFNSGPWDSIKIYAAGDAKRIFKNPMLTPGTQKKEFIPRKDSMLALQTDLYANPLTGDHADVVFENDGQYLKLTNWREIHFHEIDGWNIQTEGTHPDYKKINTLISGISHSCFVSKYDGGILTSFNGGSPDYGADLFYIDPSRQVFEISVSNSDSGWGANYTPTAEEIRAYFMGWTMRNMSASPYNDQTGSAQKTWTPIGYTPPANWNSTWTHLRTSVPVNEISPSVKDKTISLYQLVYQLTMPTVEPVISEGMLTLSEGGNQIEIGSGIVIRESVKPQRTGEAHAINDINLPGSILKHKTERILAVYKNEYRDFWEYRNNLAYGKERRVKYEGYDASAAYSITYLMLEKSPIVPFFGSYAANEKTVFIDLVNSVQLSARDTSMLMSTELKKKGVDQDWIYPTLLNGWVNHSFGTPIRYKKQNNLICIQGRLSGGRTGTTTGHTVFKLPEGFRPDRPLYLTINDATTDARFVCINSDGHVNIETGPGDNIIMDVLFSL